jgi:hypothetical protein
VSHRLLSCPNCGVSQEHMQSPEEFMRGYFEARIAEEKREEANRAPFRQKYFAGCFEDARPWQLEMFLSEKVISISSSETQAEVITMRANLGILEQTHNMRYHLRARGDSWKICGVDLPCCACDGEPGNADCPACHGTGWRTTNMSSHPATAAACGTNGGRSRINLMSIARAPAAVVRKFWLHIHR